MGLGVSSECTEDFNCGPISVTKSKTLDLNGRNHSSMLPMPPVLLSRRLLLRLSNLTPLSESALESNSRRTTRESPPTSQEMAVCPSSMRTMRSLLPVSVDLDTPKGDLPGVRFKIVKVAGCGLSAL